MTKPLGYYTSHAPGNDSVLGKLEEKYGAHLQEMSKNDKLYILSSLSLFLSCDFCPSEEIMMTTHSIMSELSESEITSFFQALTTYLREVPAND